MEEKETPIFLKMNQEVTNTLIKVLQFVEIQEHEFNYTNFEPTELAKIQEMKEKLEATKKTA